MDGNCLHSSGSKWVIVHFSGENTEISLEQGGWYSETSDRCFPASRISTSSSRLSRMCSCTIQDTFDKGFWQIRPFHPLSCQASREVMWTVTCHTKTYSRIPTNLRLLNLTIFSNAVFSVLANGYSPVLLPIFWSIDSNNSSSRELQRITAFSLSLALMLHELDCRIMPISTRRSGTLCSKVSTLVKSANDFIFFSYNISTDSTVVNQIIRLKRVQQCAARSMPSPSSNRFRAVELLSKTTIHECVRDNFLESRRFVGGNGNEPDSCISDPAPILEFVRIQSREKQRCSAHQKNCRLVCWSNCRAHRA